METSGSSSNHPLVPESLVARLWEEQFPLTLPLSTVDGEEIQVVYRGRRRWDRGPDFGGALIAGAGAELHCGDVEVHVRSSDWRVHGHHRDPHYNRVVLQVVLWHDAEGPVLREDGARVPVLALAPHLSVPLEGLSEPRPASISPAPPCWSVGERCEDALGELLDRCGLERFRAKSTRFESDLTCRSPDQLIYEGLASALGYSHNRLPFRRLSEVVSLDLLMACRGEGRGEGWAAGDQASLEMGGEDSRRVLEALLLGAAGLLPSQRGLSLEDDDGYARILEGLWSAEVGPHVGVSMRAADWEFFRVRPANFPTRRVAALAHLVSRWPRDGLAEALAALVRTLEPRTLPRALEVLLLDGSREGYWAERCDFGLRLRRAAGLLGRQRAAEIAVNVFLPFLAAWASHLGDEDLARRTLEIYRCYPKRGDNEITRYMAVQTMGAPHPRVARSACRQQGLLHIYWTCCEARRCGECPVQIASR